MSDVCTIESSRVCSGGNQLPYSHLLQPLRAQVPFDGTVAGGRASVPHLGRQQPRALSVTLSHSSSQRSRSVCGSAVAAWRSSPAVAWDTCSGSSTPTLSRVAAARSSPGKCRDQAIGDHDPDT